MNQHLSIIKSELNSRQTEVEFLQMSNNKLRSELLEKTKLNIDIDNLLGKIGYLEKENVELKQHLDGICTSYEESIE